MHADAARRDGCDGCDGGGRQQPGTGLRGLLARVAGAAARQQQAGAGGHGEA